MHATAAFVPFVIASLLAVSPRAADLIVDPNNPSAYQTLQAALDAANPGDRILLAASITENLIIVRKSVTIESMGSQRQAIRIEEWSGSPRAALRIDALSPGIPLTLRDVDLVLYEVLGAPLGVITPTGVTGEIRFDRVNVNRWSGATLSIWGGGALMDLAATVVWLRECNLQASDVLGNNGCIDIEGSSGTGGLAITANTLRMEDCTLRAGSANHLALSCCFGSPPTCSGQFATGGMGGAALRATTRNTLLVRCSLSDGNGGTVEPGNATIQWQVPVSGGPAGVSVLGGQTGRLETWATSWEAGLLGHIGAAHTGRGAVTMHGLGAPLSITGPVNPGTHVGVALATSPTTFCVFLVDLWWADGPPFWLVPFQVIPHPGNGVTMTFPIPNQPFLVGVPIVLQGVQVFPVPQVLNPSGVAIR